MLNTNSLPILKKILDNGLTVLVYKTHTLPKVALQLWYNTGSKDEMDGERGLAHLLEHMLFKGTHKLSEVDMIAITHKLSGSCNAFTSYDYTYYQFEFPANEWHIALDMLADTMSNCTFKDDLVASEMKAVIQELKLYRDDYKTTLEEEMVSLIFADHPYHYPIIGFKQDLWHINQQGLLSFYKKNYVPNNAVLTIVGDVDPLDALAQAEHYFGAIPAAPGYKKKNYYFNNDIVAKSITLRRDVQQPLSMMAYLVPGKSAQTTYILTIVAWIVANGKGSRLHKKLVNELALVTSIDAHTIDLFDHDLFFITFEPVDEQDIERIMQIITEELATIARDGVTEQELVRARKKAYVEHVGLFETNVSIADAITGSFLATGDEQYLDGYRAYSGDLQHDVQKFVARYFRATTAHTGFVLPVAQEDEDVWVALQEQIEQEDEEFLSRKMRTSPLEDGVYVEQLVAQPPVQFKFPHYQKHQLGNGCVVLWHNRKETGSVDIILEFKAKSFDDPENLQGLSNFVSEMLLQGTKNYSADALAQAFESHGMSIEVRPGVVLLSVLHEDLEHGLHLLHEILTKPVFDEVAIERVRAQLSADIKDFWDEPSEFAEQLAREHVYKNHPFSKNPLGTLDGIKRITRIDLVDFYTKIITPDGAAIALVGDLGNHDVPALLQKTLGAWQGAPALHTEFVHLEPTQPEIIRYPINRDQMVVCFAGLSVSRLDPDYDALLIFDAIFTGGSEGSMKSRLFQLREQTGLFYRIDGSLIAGSAKQPGMIYISTLVSLDAVEETAARIKGAIDTINDVAQQEFDEARRVIINSLMQNFETSADMAQTFLAFEYLGFAPDYFDTRARTLMDLDLSTARAVVKKYVTNDKLLNLYVGRAKKMRRKMS